MITPNTKPKRYIVRKIVMANSAKEALEKEVNQPVDDVFVEEVQQSQNNPVEAVGFKYLPETS